MLLAWYHRICFIYDYPRFAEFSLSLPESYRARLSEYYNGLLPRPSMIIVSTPKWFSRDSYFEHISLCQSRFSIWLRQVFVPQPRLSTWQYIWYLTRFNEMASYISAWAFRFWNYDIHYEAYAPTYVWPIYFLPIVGYFITIIRRWLIYLQPWRDKVFWISDFLIYANAFMISGDRLLSASRQYLTSSKIAKYRSEARHWR